MRNTIRGESGNSGMTVVELLIAGFILVIILGAAAAFLSQQARMQQNIQTRSELQDRVRVSMQLATQDLALAGNSVYLTSSGAKDNTVTWPFCFDGGLGCLTVENVNATTSVIAVRYLSSQFTSTDACRDVTYRVTGTVLERSDVPCEDTASFIELAPDLLEFKVKVICSNGNVYEEFDNTTCSGAYGRSASISISAQSQWPHNAAPDTNCPADRLCFAMAQEVLIPNMKGQ
ncbi:MAG: hypothetical protein WD273_07135 [Trueperaceae bacterium]